jgi:uncharacterized protein YndB with AHSA1/START domain
MLKWILIVVGALLAVVLVTMLVGAFMPREHVAASFITLRQPPDSVWQVVRDLGAAPEWWSGLESSQRASLESEGGQERWIQKMKSGSELPILVVREDPPRLLVTRIDVPDDATFGGTWTYEIEPADGGSRVTVTENGFINNLLFRFLSNTVLGMHGTMDAYLRALGSRFGEDVLPQHVVGP